MAQILKPTSTYFVEPNWESLHALTNHWKSDIAFFNDELRFFKNLVDKYFIWLIEEKSINNAKKLVAQLKNAEKELEVISSNMQFHLKQIENFIKEENTYDESFFRNEHIYLENKMVDFTNLFKQLKSDVFAITETAMEEEKVKHLLSNF